MSTYGNTNLVCGGMIKALYSIYYTVHLNFWACDLNIYCNGSSTEFSRLF